MPTWPFRPMPSTTRIQRRLHRRVVGRAHRREILRLGIEAVVARRGQVDMVEQRPVQHDVAAALGVRRHATELVEQEDVRAAERGDAGADGLDDAGVDRLGGGAGRQRDPRGRLVGEKRCEARGDVLGPGVRRLRRGRREPSLPCYPPGGSSDHAIARGADLPDEPGPSHNRPWPEPSSSSPATPARATRRLYARHRLPEAGFAPRIAAPQQAAPAPRHPRLRAGLGHLHREARATPPSPT